MRQWGTKRKARLKARPWARLAIVVRLSLLYRLGLTLRPLIPTVGHVAEWLRSGLQIRERRFDSGRGLQPSLLRSFGSASPRVRRLPRRSPEGKAGDILRTSADKPFAGRVSAVALAKADPCSFGSASQPRLANVARRSLGEDGLRFRWAISFTLCKGGRLCYRRGAEASTVFPGSSVVEQPAVNRLVAGSNPAPGANNASCSIKRWQNLKTIG